MLHFLANLECTRTFGVSSLSCPTFVYSYFSFLIWNSTSSALKGIEYFTVSQITVFLDKMEAQCAVGAACTVLSFFQVIRMTL